MRTRAKIRLQDPPHIVIDDRTTPGRTGTRQRLAHNTFKTKKIELIIRPLAGDVSLHAHRPAHTHTHTLMSQREIFSHSAFTLITPQFSAARTLARPA